MTSKLKIPKGWKQLRSGTVIIKGDKFWSDTLKLWVLSMAFGCKVGDPHCNYTYIRKIK